MPPLRTLSAARVAEILAGDGLVVDLRPIDTYLAAHIRGSVPLLYEAGPGLGGRARDLLPLDARLIVLDDGASPLDRAVDSFRGKGFEVVGAVAGDPETWPGGPVATPVVALTDAPGTLALIDVADPGTVVPSEYGVGARIPAELLWDRAGELGRTMQLGVLAGWGVRAAAAVGILEKLGFSSVTFVRTRPAGQVPPMAGAAVFRAGGPP